MTANTDRLSMKPCTSSTGVWAASGSAAKSARTAGGWTPGRRLPSGRTFSVRAPRG